MRLDQPERGDPPREHASRQNPKLHLVRGVSQGVLGQRNKRQKTFQKVKFSNKPKQGKVEREQAQKMVKLLHAEADKSSEQKRRQ